MIQNSTGSSGSGSVWLPLKSRLRAPCGRAEQGGFTQTRDFRGKNSKLVKIMLQRFQNFYSEVNKLNPPIVHSCQSDESHLEM